MREEEDDMIAFPPLPALARQPSDRPEWRCLAYYNCAICNRVGADYIIICQKKLFLLPYVVAVTFAH